MVVAVELLLGRCLSNLLGRVVSNFGARRVSNVHFVLAGGASCHMSHMTCFGARRNFVLVEKPFCVILLGKNDF